MTPPLVLSSEEIISNTGEPLGTSHPPTKESEYHPFSGGQCGSLLTTADSQSPRTALGWGETHSTWPVGQGGSGRSTTVPTDWPLPSCSQKLSPQEELRGCGCHLGTHGFPLLTCSAHTGPQEASGGPSWPAHQGLCLRHCLRPECSSPGICMLHSLFL